MSNKTQRYLSPQLNLLSTSFKDAFKVLAKEGYYFADNDYYQAYGLTELKEYLFIVIDRNGYFDSSKGLYIGKIPANQEIFQASLNKLKTHENYITDYEWKGSKHILVIGLPLGGVKKLVEGQYSTLYTDEQIELLFPELSPESRENTKLLEISNGRIDTKGILHRDKDFRNLFKELLRTKYGYTGSAADLGEDTELDIPAKHFLELEILNYSPEFKALVGIKTEDIKKEQAINPL
jgi:hypothetical protein